MPLCYRAPVADGMTVDHLAGYVKQYWPIFKTRLLAGEYHPQGVRAVDIPKPKGGTRQLGIPNVMDRLIQQALLQQLTPIFDPLFSDYSSSAHQALETARAHVVADHRWCVELDLENFFDRVNHDVLTAHVQPQAEDKRVIKLIRRYLEAGVMSGGIASRRPDSASNNRANSRIKWGLRIARENFAPRYAGCPDVEIVLVIEVIAPLTGDFSHDPKTVYLAYSSGF